MSWVLQTIEGMYFKTWKILLPSSEFEDREFCSQGDEWSYFEWEGDARLRMMIDDSWYFAEKR